MVKRSHRKKLLILVEGRSDEGVIRAFAEKLRITVRVLIMRGNNPGKALRLIRAETSAEDYDLILVLKDLHSFTEQDVLEKLEKIGSSLPSNVRGKFANIVVRKAIEAWLLSDPEALKIICYQAEPPSNPEGLDDPAEYLRRELRKCGKVYVKTRECAYNIAKHVDPFKAARKSRSLEEFLKYIKDP